MSKSTSRAEEAGRESLRRIGCLMGQTGAHLVQAASDLLTRHGYVIDGEDTGPYRNVLGHPLFHLPVWVDEAKAARRLESDVLLDICESSLCGYLSVRVEDDFFDQGIGEPEVAMMLAGFFRTRHQVLLATHVVEPEFWERFERLWHGYAEAMLLERLLKNPTREYGVEQFRKVLRRSQPLEIPGQAVLAITGRTHQADQLSRMVTHLVTATQLFNDLVDAPGDLVDGNFTWMVRRLGGLNGPDVLRSGMVTSFDEVTAEAVDELDRAVEVATALGINQIAPWVDARQQVMRQASERMYRTLLEGPQSRE